MQYFKFIENNEWEGETWNFFIPWESDELVTKFKLLIDNIAPDSESFQVVDRNRYTEAEVDLLVKEGDSGYMRQFNKCGKLRLDDMIKANLTEDDLYKGAIQDWCEKE